MLHTACQVSKGISKDIGKDGRRSLETITFAIEAYSPIDEIIYVEFEAPPSNPIWGQFLKYGKQPSVYASAQTIVEIRYAKHLSECWRRFVVCKELCHALDADEGTHSVTDRSIDRLINKFALRSTKTETTGRSSPEFQAELLAEIGALELLCPIELRKELSSSNDCSCDSLCDKFGIPSEYSIIAFDPQFVQMVEFIL